MKTALLGLGGAARRIHLPAIRAVPELELAGAADPSEKARDAALRWKIPLVEEDPAALLERVRPELVVVATPPPLHREHVLAALAAGAHVLCEKPFALTVEEADEMIASASKARRLLAVNNQYRYMRLFAEPRRRLAAGDFGPLYLAQGWQQMFHPPDREGNWRSRMPRYTLYEFGTHALDLLAFFFDAPPVAVTARVPPVPHGCGSDVLAVLLLDFPGGRVATLNLHRVSRAPTRYFELRLDAREASLRISLGGVARAAVDWADARLRVRASWTRGGEARIERDGGSRLLVLSRRPEFAGATAEHLRRLIARIRSGDVAPTAAVHAREILRTVVAAYQSAETGETVRLGNAGV